MSSIVTKYNSASEFQDSLSSQIKNLEKKIDDYTKKLGDKLRTDKELSQDDPDVQQIKEQMEGTKKGIMYECVKRKIPFVLAGSIRDDGPLPDVITDIEVAQKKYKEILKDANMVIMISTMLHSIATGNMLPADVKVIVVDINQPTVTKLMDRGTWQALGIVTDVGAFLPLVTREIEKLK